MHRAWLTGVFNHAAVIGLAAVVALHLHSAPALAQGSTGGSIGKQDKSLSGGQDGGSTSAPRERSTSRERDRPSRGERSSRREHSGGGSGGFDGAWASMVINKTCQGQTATGVVAISGGRMVSDGFAGKVSSSGSVTGVWAGGGVSATISGRMSGQRGSGTWRSSNGCTGVWTLSKQ